MSAQCGFDSNQGVSSSICDDDDNHEDDYDDDDNDAPHDQDDDPHCLATGHFFGRHTRSVQSELSTRRSRNVTHTLLTCQIYPIQL